MTTDELAELLYVSWRERREFFDPLPESDTDERQAYMDHGRDGDIWRSPRPTRRPQWSRLFTPEQQIWRHIATVALGAVGARV